MWIQFNHSTERFYDGEIVDEALEPSENGTVQVDEDIGEQLVEKHDISEYDSESD